MGGYCNILGGVVREKGERMEKGERGWKDDKGGMG